MAAYLRDITDEDAKMQLCHPTQWSFIARDPTGLIFAHGNAPSRKACEIAAVEAAEEYAHDVRALLNKSPWQSDDWRFVIWAPNRTTRNVVRLSRSQSGVLLRGIDCKLTRSSIGWSPDDGVTMSDHAYSPVTISCLWERGLLDANFVDLRVIYGGRGLIDMKNLDGAYHRHAPEIPKL
jgi:hypothetical protein